MVASVFSLRYVATLGHSILIVAPILYVAATIDGSVLLLSSLVPNPNSMHIDSEENNDCQG